MSNVEEIRQEWKPLATLALGWGLLIWLVDPRGNFPILDDWSYARSVKDLLETGSLRYDGWNAPTLVLQVFYGAAFTAPWGFSFEVLRAAALAAGLAGGVGTFLLLREAGAARWLASVGGLTLMLNPCYFQHAFTFMTDVPFAALVSFSALFYLRALRTSSVRHVAAGTLLAACATLIRQPGVMIPLAYGIAVLSMGRPTPARLTRAAAPMAAVAMVYAAYALFIRWQQLEPVLLGTMQRNLIQHFRGDDVLAAARFPLQRFGVLIADAALMALPFLLALMPVAPSWIATPARAVVAIVGSAAVFALFARGVAMPDQPYPVFTPIPLVMVGQADWGASEEYFRLRPLITSAQYLAVALLSFLLVARFLARTRASAEARAGRAGAIFGLLSAGLLLLPFLFSHLYERYLLASLPMLLVGLTCLCVPSGSAPSTPSPRLAGAVSAASLVGLGLLAVLFAHDGLLWNRVRWQAVRYLVEERKIDAMLIDGGLAVSGWYLFPHDGPLRSRYANSPNEPGHWWRNDGAKYIVAIVTPTSLQHRVAAARSSPSETLDIVWQSSYKGWLPGASGQVLVCRGELCQAAFRRR